MTEADELASVPCACYTQARRHPEVLGRVGRTVLPFQVPAPALVAGVGSFLVLLFSWKFVWSFLVPGGYAALLIVVVPLVAARAAMITSVGGRSPFLAAAGVVRYVLRCRAGVVDGRPVRRGHVRRVKGATRWSDSR